MAKAESLPTEMNHNIRLIGKSIPRKKINKKIIDEFIAPYQPIDFSTVNRTAQYFADHIESHLNELTNILLEYESYEVIQDEVARSLDLLRSLAENEQFFLLRIGAVTSFLPRNQPLYALTCFVVVPSLMASEVHFRIPHSMRHFFPRFLRVLKIDHFFPNIFVSEKKRLDFLRERSALKINPKTQEASPLTEAVIFTGTSHHAERLRIIFDQRTLFIANGSGHNPILVAEDAYIEKAVEATITLQLYNQGQDCAAPNAILVHQNSFQPFIRLLREELKKVRVGAYADRSCRVGPISDPDDLRRIQALLVENRDWLDPSTLGIIRTSEAIVEPTIICKPLTEGGNFTEVFAPIFFVQQYKNDSDLALYFENTHYPRNAMYISLYGTSKYIFNFINKSVGGHKIHDQFSILQDTHLHAPGIERGTCPYGGYGYGASSLSINGKIVYKPTLPQRDIYEHVAAPLLLSKNLVNKQRSLSLMTKIIFKDVIKLLGLKVVPISETAKDRSIKNYLDTSKLEVGKHRYIELDSTKIFPLLNNKNAQRIAILEPKHIHQIRALIELLRKKSKFDSKEFEGLLYALPKDKKLSDEDNRNEQYKFFQNIYQLLFGLNSGPRLAQFLFDANPNDLVPLLDI